jgi:hypothetical protein
MNKNNFSFDWPNFNWAKSVNQYETNKKNPFQGRSYSPLPRITQKEIKAGEAFFNPITQKYNEKQIQEKTCYQEYKSLPFKVANNYDKTLRYEQTFDIINLKDKLKVFKNHPLYPVEKESIGNKKLKDMSKIEYNILSNTNLTRHHFDKPENRPNKPSTSPVIKPLKKQVWTFKDYDIISNKYLAEHNEKAKINEQALKLEAANKYWKTHNFDPVVGTYFDPKKEEKFQQEQKKIAAEWGKDRVLRLPKKVQEQGLLYNPVNQLILDEERLTAFDIKQKNKKKRYERKNDIEEFILRKGISYSERDETRKMNKKCYDYYREADNRGYDIVNFDKNYNKYKDNLNLKDHMNDWDLLKNKSSTTTSTFGKNKLFKEEYDYSDANKNFHEFKEDRNSKHIKLNYLILKLYFIFIFHTRIFK